MTDLSKTPTREELHAEMIHGVRADGRIIIQEASAAIRKLLAVSEDYLDSATDEAFGIALDHMMDAVVAIDERNM